MSQNSSVIRSHCDYEML